MILTITNNRLENIKYKATPNVSGCITPRYICIHYTANDSFQGAINTLTNPNSKVSAHIVLGKQGELCQLASFTSKCWHVGQSEYKGLTELNKYCIGIELCNFGPLTQNKVGMFYSWNGKLIPPDDVYTDDNGKHWNTYTSAQLSVLWSLTEAIVKVYPTIIDVVGHEDLAMPRGRKQDPSVAFPMSDLRKHLFGREEVL